MAQTHNVTDVFPGFQSASAPYAVYQSTSHLLFDQSTVEQTPTPVSYFETLEPPPSKRRREVGTKNDTYTHILDYGAIPPTANPIPVSYSTPRRQLALYHDTAGVPLEGQKSTKRRRKVQNEDNPYAHISELGDHIALPPAANSIPTSCPVSLDKLYFSDLGEKSAIVYVRDGDSIHCRGESLQPRSMREATPFQPETSVSDVYTCSYRDFSIVVPRYMGDIIADSQECQKLAIDADYVSLLGGPAKVYYTKPFDNKVCLFFRTGPPNLPVTRDGISMKFLIVSLVEKADKVVAGIALITLSKLGNTDIPYVFPSKDVQRLEEKYRIIQSNFGTNLESRGIHAQARTMMAPSPLSNVGVLRHYTKLDGAFTMNDTVRAYEPNLRTALDFALEHNAVHEVNEVTQVHYAKSFSVGSQILVIVQLLLPNYHLQQVSKLHGIPVCLYRRWYDGPVIAGAFVFGWEEVCFKVQLSRSAAWVPMSDVFDALAERLKASPSLDCVKDLCKTLAGKGADTYSKPRLAHAAKPIPQLKDEARAESSWNRY